CFPPTEATSTRAHPIRAATRSANDSSKVRSSFPTMNRPPTTKRVGVGTHSLPASGDRSPPRSASLYHPGSLPSRQVPAGSLQLHLQDLRQSLQVPREADRLRLGRDFQLEFQFHLVFLRIRRPDFEVLDVRPVLSEKGPDATQLAGPVPGPDAEAAFVHRL